MIRLSVNIMKYALLVGRYFKVFCKHCILKLPVKGTTLPFIGYK